MERRESNIKPILEELDCIHDDERDLKILLKYLKNENDAVRKIVLPRLYRIIICINHKCPLFKEKYEHMLVSPRFIGDLSSTYLRKYSANKPNILMAKVLVMLVHVSRKSDRLTLKTLEKTKFFNDIFNIFVECSKIFEGSIRKLNWCDTDKSIFYITWGSLPCLLHNVMLKKQDIHENVPIICKFIFIQALLASKLLLKGEVAQNGWKEDVHLRILGLINDLLQFHQYLKVFVAVEAENLFIKWLSGTEGDVTCNYLHSSYVIKILHSYVINYPEASLNANIIHHLFDYMFKNTSNMCSHIYQGQKYCVYGDICQSLTFLINNTSRALTSYPFNEALDFLEHTTDYCIRNCISKVYVYQLIVIIKEIYQINLTEIVAATREYAIFKKYVKYHAHAVEKMKKNLRNKNSWAFDKTAFPSGGMVSLSVDDGLSASDSDSSASDCESSASDSDSSASDCESSARDSDSSNQFLHCEDTHTAKL